MPGHFRCKRKWPDTHVSSWFGYLAISMHRCDVQNPTFWETRELGQSDIIRTLHVAVSGAESCSDSLIQLSLSRASLTHHLEHISLHTSIKLLKQETRGPKTSNLRLLHKDDRTCTQQIKDQAYQGNTAESECRLRQKKHMRRL